MDRKSILILALSFGLLMLWYPLVNRLFPPTPLPPTALEDQTNGAAAGATNGGAVARPAAPASSAASGAPVELVAFPILPEGPEETLTLEAEGVRYVFTSHGGGLKQVELTHYPQSVGHRSRARALTNSVATLNDAAPVPAFALLGSAELQGDGAFALARTTNGVRAEKELTNSLWVIKEFVPGTNYLLHTRVRIENRGSEPRRVPLQELVIGTATPMDAHDVGTLQGIQWYDGRRAQWVDNNWFANRTLGCLPGTPRLVHVAGQSNVVWAAAHNRFFALVAIPPTNAPAPQLIARRINLPAPTPAELQQDRRMVAQPFGIQTGLLYPERTLGPGQAIELVFDVFAGPKEYRTLDRLSQRLGNQLDLVMRFGFGAFFAKGLLLSMNAIHSLGISYGLTIIVITILIKLVFWWPTQASTRSMKRMQALQPQIKAIQEKYKDTPDKMNRKVMEFMKENKVNPAAGCLPILIQLPVFIGFYQMLQSAIELRGASFLWAADLSQPDTVWFIPGLGWPVNPLPLIMGATQFWQMKLTPTSPTADPVQQKIFQYMPLIFLFILYNFSSGLTLYWTVQNLLTIAQTKLTKTSNAKTVAVPGVATAKVAATPTRPAKKKKN